MNAGLALSASVAIAAACWLISLALDRWTRVRDGQPLREAGRRR